MIWIILCLTFFINLFFIAQTTYRISGVKSGKLATSRSISEYIGLLSRAFHILQFPILVGLLEGQIETGISNNGQALYDIRIMLIMSSVGILIGLLYLSFFERIITKATNQYYKEKNELNLLNWFFLKFPQLVSTLIKHRFGFEYKKKSLLQPELPYKILIISTLCMTFLFLGNYACLYAGIIYPKYRMTAMSLTGIINGVSTIGAVLFVDNRLALYTDMAKRNEISISWLESFVKAYCVTVFIGSLFAQILIVPSAHFIVLVIDFLK